VRCIIAGTRYYTPTSQEITAALAAKAWAPTRVLSGTCRGADRQGGLWAAEHKVEVHWYMPDWERYGKRAGPMRNARMVQAADALLAFHDGVSRGTADVIRKARGAGLGVHVVPVEVTHVTADEREFWDRLDGLTG